MKSIRGFVEPTIVHVRSSGSDGSATVKGAIQKSLTEDHGFIELAVNDLIREESDRRTKLGNRLLHSYSTGQQFSLDMYVQLLQPIIYAGHESRDKFLLVGFPETTEQVTAFEEHCATLNAIIFATDKGNVVDIKNNETSLFNIDSMFQKQFRLKQMDSWDFSKFEEHLGSNINWGLVTGRAFSGRSEYAKQVGTMTNSTIINMDTVAEGCKKRLTGPDEETFEGDVPVEEIQKDICAIFDGDKTSGKKVSYIFDGFHHKPAGAFVSWATESFGAPNFWLACNCNKDTAGDRWKKANEAEELTEDATEEIAGQGAAWDQEKKETDAALEQFAAMTKHDISTDKSAESVSQELKGLFCAKIVIVNHDPRLPVDVSCANLAIKYNMLYLSVHQLIREHIRNNTKFGERLLESRHQVSLSEAFHQVGVIDAHDEMQYTAVHFNLHLVMEMIQSTVAERRTNQRFILIEGLCNSNKLANEEDQLTLRYMDEFFQIEKYLGEVTAVVSLTFNKEEMPDESKIKLEEFPEEEVVVKEAKPAGEEGEEEEEQPPAAEEEEGEKVEKFDPKKFTWTITNRESKNLLTLFTNLRSINALPDLRDAENYSKQHYQAVTQSLDEFCNRIVEESSSRNLYLQVLFSDQ